MTQCRLKIQKSTLLRHKFCFIETTRLGKPEEARWVAAPAGITLHTPPTIPV
jgi:hypothetical protein